MSNLAVSSALIREELGAQHPVFYTSKALLDAKTRYSKLEKIILALVVSTFVAEFTPSTEEEKLVNKKKESSKADGAFAEPDQPRDMWQFRVDVASNQKGAGASVVVITPDGTLLEQAVTLGFPTSNNEAEY
ncbi:hypothetical protein L3X38_032541 [Prunus dulcis]|uniref:Reverse transcriptase RNase H-like domain-containing protein n=1 Tax=Prunus dulcis TaxID=3755 RepID=A0AAD4YW48_PRUDU|nr:hypothetical protein L3X38_032541 [Prunus dulcis]